MHVHVAYERVFGTRDTFWKRKGTIPLWWHRGGKVRGILHVTAPLFQLEALELAPEVRGEHGDGRCIILLC